MGVSFGQLMFTADSLANADEHDIRNWRVNSFVAAMKIAIKAAAQL